MPARTTEDCRGVGDTTHFPFCRRGSKARKLDSPDIATDFIKQLLLGQCQSEHLLAIKHTHGGCPPRGALSQHSGQAMAHSQPHDPPWTRPPPSSGALFP